MGEVFPKHKAEESPRLPLRFAEGKAKLGLTALVPGTPLGVEGGQKGDFKVSGNVIAAD